MPRLKRPDGCHIVCMCDNCPGDTREKLPCLGGLPDRGATPLTGPGSDLRYSRAGHRLKTKMKNNLKTANLNEPKM